MSTTEEILKVVTRRCDYCGEEESGTVLETDTPGVELTWEKPWRAFRILNWLQHPGAQNRDACSRECFVRMAEEWWDA